MKEFFIVHAGDYVGAYLNTKYPVISYAPQEKFCDFILSLRETFPDYKLRCVVDKSITQKVINNIKMTKSLER